MSTALILNTMRFGSDTVSFSKKAFWIRNTTLDCSVLTEVNGVAMAGTQPSGTDRRLAFKVNGTWYKLTGTGTVTLTALATQTLTADSLLSEGNTVAEVTAATLISGFVGKHVGRLIGGVYTVEDDELYRLLALLADTEKVFLEPSALAGFVGPLRLPDPGADAIHIAWATGGSMVPDEMMQAFYQKGSTLLSSLSR